MFYILDINTNFCDCLIRIFIFLGHIMNFIKISVPIIVILMGSIDLIKAVVAQKDDEMKKAQSIFIKRLIYGVALFFIIAIVQFLIGLIGGDTNNRCFKCVSDVNSSACDKENIPVCRKESTEPEVETPDDEVTVDDNNDENVPNKEEPNLEGWNCSNGTGPIEGCRVHFSGLFITDGHICDDLEVGELKYVDGTMVVTKNGVCHHNQPIFFEADSDSDILGRGEYFNFPDNIPNSVNITFDSFAIDSGTKLVIYEKENFQGKILLEKEGPFVYYNKEYANEESDRYKNGMYDLYKDYYNKLLVKKFIGYESNYPSSNRAFTTWYLTTMYARETPGSFKICCKSE